MKLSKEKSNEALELLENIHAGLYIGEDLKDEDILYFYVDVVQTCREEIKKFLDSLQPSPLNGKYKQLDIEEEIRKVNENY